MRRNLPSMKIFLVAVLAVGALLSPWPAAAQSQTADLATVQQTLRAVGLRPEQVKELMATLIANAPLLLNESADNRAVVRDLTPQLSRILDQDQLHLLSLLEQEAARVDDLGLMTPRERKLWMQDGLRALVHPDLHTWLERLGPQNR